MNEKKRERLLVEAVTAYRAALKIYTKETFPQHWAAVQNNLGAVLNDQGLLSDGSTAMSLFDESLAAYNAAETVYTRVQLPQQWAMTQNNLGNVLHEKGIRAGGTHGMLLLVRSIAALEAALTIYTKELSAKDWAMAQNNLGNSLREQGLSIGGENGTKLLRQAVAAYLAALEVRTSDHDPKDWAQTQGNLGRAYLALNDREGAAKSYRNALAIFPNHVEAYVVSVGIYHEELFRYAEAFALNEEWLKWHPDDLAAESRFAETHITTGRYTEAHKRLVALISNPQVSPGASLWLRALEITDLVALGKTDSIPDRLDRLQDFVSSKPLTFTGAAASFQGTKHYIEQNQTFEKHRPWLLGLLTGLEGKKRDQMLVEIHAARKRFLTTVKH